MRLGIILLLLNLNVALAASFNSIDTDKIEVIQEKILKSSHYSSLKRVKLKTYLISNPDYFMESNFSFKRFFGVKNYRIGINPLIFRNGISDEALTGVMAHELVHTLDYENRGILSVGHQYLCNNHPYERKTDLRVIFNGFGEELSEYKQWQYKLLSPKALKKKKKKYLTPEEIEFIHRAIGEVQDKENLLNYWLKKIPMNQHQFEKSFNQYLTEHP